MDKKWPPPRGAARPAGAQTTPRRASTPAVAQAKRPTAAPPKPSPPAAPPVYRPEARPAAAQRKTATPPQTRPRPNVQPAYRPQFVPRCLQTKTTTAAPTPANRFPQPRPTPNAPRPPRGPQTLQAKRPVAGPTRPPAPHAARGPQPTPPQGVARVHAPQPHTPPRAPVLQMKSSGVIQMTTRWRCTVHAGFAVTQKKKPRCPDCKSNRSVEEVADVKAPAAAAVDPAAEALREYPDAVDAKSSVAFTLEGAAEVEAMWVFVNAAGKATTSKVFKATASDGAHAESYMVPNFTGGLKKGKGGFKEGLDNYYATDLKEGKHVTSAAPVKQQVTARPRIEFHVSSEPCNDRCKPLIRGVRPLVGADIPILVYALKLWESKFAGQKAWPLYYVSAGGEWKDDKVNWKPS